MDDSAIPLITPAAPRLSDPEPGEWETRCRPVRGRRLLSSVFSPDRVIDYDDSGHLTVDEPTPDYLVKACEPW